MSRAVGIKGRGTEMCSVLVGRAEGIILPGFGQASIKRKKKSELAYFIYKPYLCNIGFAQPTFALRDPFLNICYKFIQQCNTLILIR